MNRIDIINSLIAKHGYTSYVEIGVRHREHCFDHITCRDKVSVDPGTDHGPYDFNCTSDEFFAQNNRVFDLIFIDGWHSAEQASKDVNNALACLSKNGSIVLHDCSPPDEGHTSLSLCGTVWKVIYWLRTSRPDLIVRTVDTDYGVGIVQRCDSHSAPACNSVPAFNLFFDYGVMATRRQESLGLISVDEFKKLYLDPEPPRAALLSGANFAGSASPPRIFLGVPVLNRFDLLEQALKSFDYPNIELFIVNNNTVDPENRAYFDRLKEQYQFDSFSPRYNLGVAASWNRIITTAWSRGYEFVYVGSNDTTLGPGTLKMFAEMSKPEPEALWLLNHFNFWCLRLAAVQKIGLFDENFMPAYFEDNDFFYRVGLAGLEVLHLHDHEFEHNGRIVPAVHSTHLGSQTIASDADYAEGNNHTFWNWNATHFNMKWGGGPLNEQFKTPYNKTDKDHRWWPDPDRSVEARDWDNNKRAKLLGDNTVK